jgi:hypothetical protein
MADDKPPTDYVKLQAALSAMAESLASRFEFLTQFQAPLFDKLARAFQDLPQRTRSALRTLAQNGWYLDPSLALPDLWELERLFLEGNADRAHQTLCDHFDRRTDTIREDLCRRFGRRARILNAAFDAHAEGRFALSIPVFLAQADGICQDLWSVQLYARGGTGAPKIAEHLPQIDSEFLIAACRTPLQEGHPMIARASERAGLGNVLNRHAILHGKDCSYDTRLNSFRCVSWLIYVAWALDPKWGQGWIADD